MCTDCARTQAKKLTVGLPFPSIQITRVQDSLYGGMDSRIWRPRIRPVHLVIRSGYACILTLWPSLAGIPHIVTSSGLGHQSVHCAEHSYIPRASALGTLFLCFDADEIETIPRGTLSNRDRWLWLAFLSPTAACWSEVRNNIGQHVPTYIPSLGLLLFFPLRTSNSNTMILLHMVQGIDMGGC